MVQQTRLRNLKDKKIKEMMLQAIHNNSKIHQVVQAINNRAVKMDTNNNSPILRAVHNNNSQILRAVQAILQAVKAEINNNSLTLETVDDKKMIKYFEI